jgi:hypothetical protein
VILGGFALALIYFARKTQAAATVAPASSAAAPVQGNLTTAKCAAHVAEYTPIRCAALPPSTLHVIPAPAKIPPPPVFNSPAALATPTPALCQYKALETTNPTSLVSAIASGNPVSLFIKNLTECFCQVNALYGKALEQGVASGKICRNFPTPAGAKAQLRSLTHATSGVRRAALGCLSGYGCYGG